MIITVRQLNAALNIAKHFKEVAPDGFMSFCEEAIETLLRLKLNEWDFENENLAEFIVNTAKIAEQRSKLPRYSRR